MGNLEPVVTLQRVASRLNRGQTGASMEQMRKELRVVRTVSSITKRLRRKNEERKIASHQGVSISRYTLTHLNEEEKSAMG